MAAVSALVLLIFYAGGGRDKLVEEELLDRKKVPAIISQGPSNVNISLLFQDSDC